MHHKHKHARNINPLFGGSLEGCGCSRRQVLEVASFTCPEQGSHTSLSCNWTGNKFVHIFSERKLFWIFNRSLSSLRPQMLVPPPPNRKLFLDHSSIPASVSKLERRNGLCREPRAAQQQCQVRVIRCCNFSNDVCRVVCWMMCEGPREGCVRSSLCRCAYL